jgi:hypothetical protein
MWMNLEHDVFALFSSLSVPTYAGFRVVSERYWSQLGIYRRSCSLPKQTREQRLAKKRLWNLGYTQRNRAKEALRHRLYRIRKLNGTQTTDGAGQ